MSFFSLQPQLGVTKQDSFLHIYIYIVKFSDLFLDMMEFKFSSVSFLF